MYLNWPLWTTLPYLPSAGVERDVPAPPLSSVLLSCSGDVPFSPAGIRRSITCEGVKDGLWGAGIEVEGLTLKKSFTSGSVLLLGIIHSFALSSNERSSGPTKRKKIWSYWMCLELVNINLGFQESIHGTSLKQESLRLSLPWPYCCRTIFISFLPDKVFLIILFHGIWFCVSLE